MKLKILSLIALSCLTTSGCAVVNFGKKQAYKAEIKYSEKYMNGELKEKLDEEVAKGNLTEKQAEAIFDAGEKFLPYIKQRAERKLKELEEGK